MSVGSTDLHTGHVLSDVVCPCCSVSQLEGPDKPADKCHAYKHCGHAWESDTICTANLLPSLRPYLSKVLWCLNLCVIGSAYLFPSLLRSWQYLWCIWRWSSKSVTSTLLIGQPTMGKRVRLGLKAPRSFWKSLNLPIHRYLLSLNILSLTTICCSPFH